MAKLKQLATAYLTAKHPELIANVKAAFNWVPSTELDYRASSDIFHYIGSHLYDEHARWSTSLKADAAIASVVALLDTLNAESADFEAFILTQGIAKAATPAPKSMGF